jgi:hypothetical protein
MTSEELHDAVEQHQDALTLLQKEISKLKEQSADLRNDNRFLLALFSYLQKFVLAQSSGSVPELSRKKFDLLLQQMGDKYDFASLL